jgi:predicted Zn-dependent protease
VQRGKITWWRAKTRREICLESFEWQECSFTAKCLANMNVENWNMMFSWFSMTRKEKFDITLRSAPT